MDKRKTDVKSTSDVRANTYIDFMFPLWQFANAVRPKIHLVLYCNRRLEPFVTIVRDNNLGRFGVYSSVARV
jgi:hypothetical protein